VKRLENECNNRQRLPSINHEKDHSKKKHSRKEQSNELNESTINSHRKQIHSDLNTNIPTTTSTSKSLSTRHWSINHILIPFCLIT
jgi:hypothetical protein